MREIGTGLTGIGMENGASIQVTAVTMAMRTRRRVVKRLDELFGFVVVIFFIVFRCHRAAACLLSYVKLQKIFCIKSIWEKKIFVNYIK